MGFRKDTWATVWQVMPQSDAVTRCRISINRKDKTTGAYETDFSGFVSFVGTMAAKKAAGLKERDRIKLGDVDVTNRYDKEKNVTYTNFAVFNFEKDDSVGYPNGSQGGGTTTNPVNRSGAEFISMDGIEDTDLPF